LTQGSKLTIRARTSDNTWLLVETAVGERGWVLVREIDLGKASLAEIPQSGLQSVSTPTPNLAATAAACKPQAQVTDVTVPDRSQFKPGEAFVKTWRFTSSGNCPWESGSMLAFQGGDKMGAPDNVPVDVVDVGKSIEVSVNLKAPTIPGNYASQWALQRPSGQVITTTDVSIVVSVPTSTPTRVAVPPTQPPVAAATATPGPATSGTIGPVGTGPLDAAYTGWGNCVPHLDEATNGWVWEADFFIDVHGGTAGYFIVGNPPNCRWDYGQLKFACHWGGRDEVPMVQSVTINCPNCKPVKVDIIASIRHRSFQGVMGCE
jgi:hypothetical protein